MSETRPAARRTNIAAARGVLHSVDAYRALRNGEARADFPIEIADLAQGKVWLTDDVEAWMKIHRHDDADSDGEA